MRQGGTGQEVCGCYDPKGRLLGTLTTSKLQALYRGYHRTGSGQPDRGTTRLDTFEEAVAKLLLRYRDGYKHSCGQSTRLKNHWANPDCIMRMLHLGFGVHKERFASPLNCSALTETYWSLYKEDEAFGAHWDAYSCRWEGASEANPALAGTPLTGGCAGTWKRPHTRAGRTPDSGTNNG